MKLRILLACSLAITAPLASQQTEITYQVDWRNKQSDQKRKLRAGKQTRISVTGLTPFCYSFVIRANQLVVTEESSRSIANILLGETPIPTPLNLPAPKPKPATTADDGKPPKGTAAANVPDFGPVKNRLEELKASIHASTKWYDSSTILVDSLSKRREKAKAALDAFVKQACMDSERGMKHDAAVRLWKDSISARVLAFADAKDLFAALQGAVNAGLKEITSANAQYLALSASTEAVVKQYLAGEGKIEFEHDDMLIKAIQAHLTAVSSGPNATLTKDRKDTRSVHDALDGFAKEKDFWEQPVFLRDDTERLTVAITATGRTLPGDVKQATITETYEAPVARLARTLTSIGFIFSSIENRDFGRVTFPRFRGDTAVIKDSIYSTYADKARAGKFAIAPFVTTHLRVVARNEFVGYISGGLGARAVGDVTGAEYLLGVSLGIGERGFITIGSHWGRQEVLLLGNVDEVSRKAVPSAIGDDSAVGTRWISALAVALSWRIN